MSDVTRRDFLRLTSLGLAASACATDEPADIAIDAGESLDARADTASIRARDLDSISASDKFALGVMAGDATADHAMLWTKYSGAHALLLYVQEDGGPGVHEAPASIAPGGFVHVDVPLPRAGKRYHYAFLERASDGTIVARSAIGRFRSALAADALEPVTFAGLSCTSQFRDVTNANLLRLAQRSDLSFVLHAGDQLYADFPTDAPARDLAAYRAKYEYAWSRAGLRAVHQAFGTYNTWDDHEVYNNWQGYRDEARIGAAYDAFFSHLPIRRVATAPRQLWRSFRWGRTLELFVLDSRGERDVAAGKYVSEAQLAWLEAGLRSSTAVFKMILNSCPIGVFPADTIDRWRSPTDRWANPAFAAQRTRILDVAQEVGGVWWLSGDFHFGTVGRVQYPTTSKYTRVREVLMGAGGQGLGSSTELPGTTRIAQVRALEDNVNWTFATPENNYVVIRANPLPDATHPTPWLDIAFYDATRQLFTGTYRLL